MLSKVEHCNDKSPGGNTECHNSLPEGWREITEKEFAQSMFFTYSPRYIEYRQAKVDENGPIIGIHIFYFHDDTGIAFVNDFWKGTVRYFATGCNHNYEERSVKWARERGILHFGNCYHVYECTKCKRTKSEDSSD